MDDDNGDGSNNGTNGDGNGWPPDIETLTEEDEALEKRQEENDS